MNNVQADEAYLTHYQLTHDPFAARVPNFKFYPAQRKTILGQLHHLARHSQLMLVVTGPRGSGKTLLRQALIASINKDTVKIINVSAADCSRVSDVLTLLGKELHAQENTVEAIIGQVNRLTEKNVSLYFMIDDADQLSDDVLQVLLNLSNEQLIGLRLFLFARPTLLDVLEATSLGKEVTFNLPLTPYTLEETKQYLSSRLDGAGQSLTLFSDDQLLDIYTKSGGWPGIINQVAKDTLLLNMDEPQLFSAISDEHEQEETDPPLFAENDSFTANHDTDLPRKTPKVDKSKTIIPKKHLIIAGVIALVLIGIIFFSRSSNTNQQSDPSVVDQHYADLPNKDTQTTTIALTPETNTVETNNTATGNTPMTDIPVTPPVTNTVTQPTTATEPTTTTTPSTEPTVDTSVTTATNTQVAPSQNTTVKPATTPSTPSTKPAVAEKTTTKAEKTKKTTQNLSSENKWYSSQPSNHFTVQVSVASSVKLAQDFLKKHAGDYRYFKRLRSGKVDYVITYGNYSTRSAAQEAIKTMPASIRNSKPWVRSFASVKSELAN